MNVGGSLLTENKGRPRIGIFDQCKWSSSCNKNLPPIVEKRWEEEGDQYV
jgi:hypothetical protein